MWGPGGHRDPVPGVSHQTQAGLLGRSLLCWRHQEKPGWAGPRVLLQVLEGPEGFWVARGSAEAEGQRVAVLGQGDSATPDLTRGGDTPGAAPHPKLTPS